MSESELPLDQLKEAAHLRDYAQQKYDEAYKRCIDARVHNRAIAKVLGVSDTAVRTYAKRKGWRS